MCGADTAVEERESESAKAASKSGILFGGTRSILVFQEPEPQCKETWLTGSCLLWAGEK